MNTIRIVLPIALLLGCVAAVVSADDRTVTVAQDGSGDFNGDTDVPIRKALEAAGAGGTVLIKAGRYTIWHTLHLDDFPRRTVRGKKGTILELPPLPLTSITADAAAGVRSLTVADGSQFRTGTKVRIKAPGRTDIHHGKPVLIPTFDITLGNVEGNTLHLQKPLPYAAPQGAPIAFAENLFEIRSGGDITLENLILDGNHQENAPDFVGHVSLCTFLASGPYSYTDGLVGEPIQNLRILNCTFRNITGRGIAWYAVTNSTIQGCTIEGTHDAAIDIDHFCYDLSVLDNTIRDCGIGVEINDGSRCDIRANRITNCDRGIYIWRWCENDDVNVDNTLIGNTILNSGKAAIEVGIRTERNSVVGNWLEGGEGVGIQFLGESGRIADNRVVGFVKGAMNVAGKNVEIGGNLMVEEK